LSRSCLRSIQHRFKDPKTKAYYLFRVFGARDTDDLSRSIEPQQQQRRLCVQQRRPSGGVERLRLQVVLDSFNRLSLWPWRRTYYNARRWIGAHRLGKGKRGSSVQFMIRFISSVHEVVGLLAWRFTSFTGYCKWITTTYWHFHRAPSYLSEPLPAGEPGLPGHS
jgi:hypothetical protein